MRAWRCGPVPVSAAPGRGQDPPGARVRPRAAARRRSSRAVVVVCPTAPLTRQWAGAAGAARRAPRARRRRARARRATSTASPSPTRGSRWSASAWARAVRGPTLVIADEAHHLGEDLAWGDGLRARVPRRAARWLLLSGTPFRSRRRRRSRACATTDGVAVPDVSYTYADAVRDGICRPVTFIPYDGSLQWRSGDDVVEASFADRPDRPRGGAPLPHRDLGRAARRPAADPRRRPRAAAGACAPAGTATPAASSSPPTASTRARSRRLLRGRHAARAPTVVLHTEARAAREARGVHALARARGSSR